MLAAPPPAQHTRPTARRPPPRRRPGVLGGGQVILALGHLRPITRLHWRSSAPTTLRTSPDRRVLGGNPFPAWRHLFPPNTPGLRPEGGLPVVGRVLSTAQPLVPRLETGLVSTQERLSRLETDLVSTQERLRGLETDFVFTQERLQKLKMTLRLTKTRLGHHSPNVGE